MSWWAQARHTHTMIITYARFSICNNMFFLPFLYVRLQYVELHYQSPIMLKHCVAAFCNTKRGVGYMSSKTGAKWQRNTEFGQSFI